MEVPELSQRSFSEKCIIFASKVDDFAARKTAVPRFAADAVLSGASMVATYLAYTFPTEFHQAFTPLSDLYTTNSLLKELFDAKTLNRVGKVISESYAGATPIMTQTLAATVGSKWAINSLVAIGRRNKLKEVFGEKIPWSTTVLPGIAEFIRRFAQITGKKKVDRSI